MSDEPMLKLTEVARIFDVKPYTIRSWIHERKIEAVQLPNGHYRISQSEVTRLANQKYGATS